MSTNIKYFPRPIKRLVVSGGGARGLAALGSLHYLDENRFLENIEEYWGTSVGSIITVLLLIGYTPFEAFHNFFMLDQFADPTMIGETESAFCPIEVFGARIREFIDKKLGPNSDPTFFDLWVKFGKKVHIIGTNTDTMRGEVFDVDNTPLMAVIDAIEISCDLPYIFSKKIYNGHTYVDGGFINNYPVDLADDGQTVGLGVCIFGDMHAGNKSIGWIYRLIQIPIMELHRERVSRLSDKFINIELTVEDVNVIELSPDYRKKIRIFSDGYQQTREILKEKEDEYIALGNKFDYSGAEEPQGWDVEFDWSD